MKDRWDCMKSFKLFKRFERNRSKKIDFAFRNFLINDEGTTMSLIIQTKRKAKLEMRMV